MKCRMCGTEAAEDACFCSVCGSWLNGQTKEAVKEKNVDKEELQRRLSVNGTKYSGKKICEELRNLRLQFAQANALEYEEKECKNQNPCNGTCAYCEQKLEELNQKAALAGVEKKIIYPEKEVNRILGQYTYPMLMGMMRCSDFEKETEKTGFFRKVKAFFRR